MTSIQQKIEQAKPDSREAIAKRESGNLAAIADMIEELQKDKWLDQLFGAAKNEHDVSDIEKYMPKWGLGNPYLQYKSPAHCIVNHADRHGFRGNYIKYLRKSVNFNKKRSRKKRIEPGVWRWNRMNSNEYLIERDGLIVSYGA